MLIRLPFSPGKAHSALALCGQWRQENKICALHGGHLPRLRPYYSVVVKHNLRQDGRLRLSCAVVRLRGKISRKTGDGEPL